MINKKLINKVRNSFIDSYLIIDHNDRFFWCDKNKSNKLDDNFVDIYFVDEKQKENHFTIDLTKVSIDPKNRFLLNIPDLNLDLMITSLVDLS